MRYYQCDKYPIEFVVSENIDKHFGSHNHVGHYVISVVMQGTIAALGIISMKHSWKRMR